MPTEMPATRIVYTIVCARVGHAASIPSSNAIRCASQVLVGPGFRRQHRGARRYAKASSTVETLSYSWMSPNERRFAPLTSFNEL